jgi:hypothetical protein
MHIGVFRHALAALLAVVLLAGCKDEESVSSEVVLSDSEAASLVGASLAGGQSTYGLSAQAADAAALVADGGPGKVVGYAAPDFDTTVTRQWSGTWGNRTYSYNYTFNFSYEFTLGGLTYGYAMHGIYDTPWMSSDDSAAAAWSLTGMPGAPFTLNGTYQRWGSQASKVLARNSFTSLITMTLTSVTIDRDTRQITGGTAAGVVQGESTTGRAFSYTYTVTFLGNQAATVVINGVTFNVDLNSGEASRR